ncbi:hypothetical protein [Nocardia sputorum]|nr:hypothetical protein [Nocardia sputorum]
MPISAARLAFSPCRPHHPGRLAARSSSDWKWLNACGISHGKDDPISR